MENEIKHFAIKELTGTLTALIVTDDKISEELSLYLNDIFSKVTYINNCKNNITQYYQNNQVDFIFLDIGFKNMHSFEVAESIKSINKTQIVIALSNIRNEELLLKSIRYGINDFLVKPISTVDIKDAIIRCQRCILEKNKLDYLDANKSISYLMENFLTDIDLSNNYKGVPIVRKAKLVDITEGLVSIRVDDIQMYALKQLQHSTISSGYLSGEIYAKLKEVDFSKNIATFDNFEFINSYINHRKQVRVAPSKDFSVILKEKSIIINSQVINLSQNHILLKINDDKFDLDLNSDYDLKIHFKIPSYLASHVSKDFTINVKAIVSDIFDFDGFKKVLLYFELENNDNIMYDNYIKHRTKELIEEFKKSIE